MTLQRCTSSLLLILAGLAGCAGLQPPPIPKTPSPTDLIKSIPQGNNTTLVNIQPPTNQHQTLPDFLGITRCCYGTIACCNTVRTQAAFCFPGLAGIIEPGAGIPGGELPENAPSSVEAAAAIKAKEGQAQAGNLLALRYLAEFGCGCYNEDGSVEKAFYDALTDCTEAVRFEAVMALRKVAGGECKCQKCNSCNEKCCCTEKIQKKLFELAYETNDMGCPKEPSERVRRVARIVLRLCGPVPCSPEPDPADKKETKAEGPAGEGPEAKPAEKPAENGENTQQDKAPEAK